MMTHHSRDPRYLLSLQGHPGCIDPAQVGFSHGRRKHDGAVCCQRRSQPAELGTLAVLRYQTYVDRISSRINHRVSAACRNGHRQGHGTSNPVRSPSHLDASKLGVPGRLGDIGLETGRFFCAEDLQLGHRGLEHEKAKLPQCHSSLDLHNKTRHCL